MYGKRYLREDDMFAELQRAFEDNSDGGEIFSDDSDDELLPQTTREVVNESSNSNDTDSSDAEKENLQSNKGDSCNGRGEEPVPASSSDVHREVSDEVEVEMATKQRNIKFCKCNKTTSECTVCKKMVCGRCTKKIHYKCVNCVEG